MPAIISMLRAVNVGPHNRIKMEDLRAVYESIGLRNPKTYVQSGNVIFQSSETDLQALAKRIEAAIQAKFGFHSSVILRTVAELNQVITGNPFSGRRDIEPNKLLVTFLAAAPAPEAHDYVRQLPPTVEEIHLSGRELYIYFPEGSGRSKLPVATIARRLNTPGTARNWNSITKMAEIAASLEQ